MTAFSWGLPFLNHGRGLRRPRHRQNDFFLWLAAHNPCWTSDWLVSHGLPHLEKCPLYDQADEDHLPVSCVFSRQFLYHVLRQVSLHSFSPQPADLSFDVWWEKTHATTSGLTKKGLDSIIVLGAWIVWNHCNQCVFDGVSPNLVEIWSWPTKSVSNGCWLGLVSSHLAAPLPGD
jgi:hypothetical protein